MGREKGKKWVSFQILPDLFSKMIPNLSLSENQALFMIIYNLSETTVMTYTHQSQYPTLPMSFAPFSPPYPASQHHLCWQFNITPFLAPFSWTRTSLAAEWGSHKPLYFYGWIKRLFLQGTKGWLPLVPKSTLKIKKPFAELLKC